MTETGTVTKINGGNVTVRFDRKTDCENCKMCMFSEEAKFVETEVENSVNAEIGDTVTVNMPGRTVLLYSLIVYMLPLVFCAAGLIAGYFALGDAAALIFGALMLAAGFLVVTLIDKKLKGKAKRPEITAIFRRTGTKNESA